MSDRNGQQRRSANPESRAINGNRTLDLEQSRDMVRRARIIDLADALRDVYGRRLFLSEPPDDGEAFACAMCKNHTAIALDPNRWSCVTCGAKSTKVKFAAAVLMDPRAISHLDRILLGYEVAPWD